MRRAWMMSVGLGLLMWPGGVVRLAAETQSGTSSPSSVSGMVTSVDVDGLSPSLTISDPSGKTTTVTIDRANTTVSGPTGSGALSDLKEGQQVQISGRYMTYVGQIVAKSITISQAAAPAAAPAAPKATAPSQTKPTTPAGPRVLKSTESSQHATSSKP